ncbi:MULTISPECIES: hypothetical protein [unclassified Leptolyngbya]|uniref:hypothetical protein n=1 Tax=unclassified Leptolyngbya TaxID=2650499 RepID=UPI00168913FE|nr:MULTISPECIES: hypothetical protein [unclassified Leptolyngbya]MBD1911554.1 hypothetical protein [Leptolyngbya sp. FACHB-8]MBD2155588.1 hypothetical protein [Leptolyngbya sp. FACHB-16]
MIFKSTRLAAGLAIASGLALLFPTAGNAQIRVTGGQLSGNAAFFVPGQNIAPGQTTPGTSLFDLSVQELRIESENGTSTTSIFVPTSATFDDRGNQAVDAGDTGILQGYLSGVALTQNGNLLPFTQRETILSFEVDSFASSLNFNGTLISPSVLGSAPLIFLPGLENATVEGSEFTATEGELQVGDLDTTLNDGLINLPSTLSFSPSGGGSNPPTSVPILQRLNFRFEGEDLAAGSYLFNTTSDGIRFVGEANQRFEINAQSAPAPGRSTSTFRIRGEGGIVDATLTGAAAQIDGSLPLDRFQIRGNGRVEGVLATFGAYGTDGVAFSSTGTRGQIRYNFEQGGTRSEGEASEIQFTAFPGLGDISSIDTDTSDGYNFDESFNSGSDDDGGQGATSTCNVCGTTINITNPIQVGPYVTVFYPGQPIQVTGGDNNTTTNNYTIAINRLDSANYTSNTTLNTSLLTLSSFDVSAFSQQLILLSSSENVEFGRTNRRQRYEIRYQEIGGGRYYVIVPRGSNEVDDELEVDDDEFETDDTTVVTAYRLIGPSSRIFPSLVGLRQLSPDTTVDSQTDDTDVDTDEDTVDDGTTVDTDEDTVDDGTTVDTEDDVTDDDTTVDTEDDVLDDGATVDTEDDVVDDGTTVDTEDSVVDDGTTIDTDSTVDDDTQDDSIDDGASLDAGDDATLDAAEDTTVEVDDTASDTVTITVETDATVSPDGSDLDTDDTTVEPAGN